jgi:HK97 family phage major capsid protein
MVKEVTMQEVSEAVTELKNRVEKGVLDPEVLEKINITLDAQEAKNQELIEKQKAAEKQADEWKARLDVLEAEMSRSAQSSKTNFRETDEYKALQAYVMEGQVDRKTLRTDSDANGGFLVPSAMDNMITKKITEVSNIRSIARVRTISSKSLSVPKRATIPTAAYEGELETGTDSNSTYEEETLTPYRQTFSTPISMDMLMDSAFNMEAEIMGDAAEAFAKGEGTGFVLGTGVKQPEGFLVNAELIAAARESSTSAQIDAKDVILLTGDLKVGYDPVYVMNRRTLAYLRTLVSTDGNFLWQPGMNGAVANTLNGFQYVLADDMPDMASSSLSIAFGDFRRGYLITDRTGLVVIRDEYTLKKKAAVEFTMMRWNTGQVVVPEAIKLLKTKA